jgi:hypothetical protein
MASEMRTIKLGDQDWKVTPFHCVVGPITHEHFMQLYGAHFEQLGSPKLIDRPDPFDYVIGRAEKLVARWRGWRTQREASGLPGWALCYTGDPLFVNELELEEITLACIDDGKLIVTNFADLPGADVAGKIYFPGEFWLNYAEGGAEKALREGLPRKGSLR